MGKSKSGGNNVSIATASGRKLGGDDPHQQLKRSGCFQKKTLDVFLKEFAELPKEERMPTIEDPATAKPAASSRQKPPANGLFLRAHCSYVKLDDKKQWVRAEEYWFGWDPNARWKVETQTDHFWLTEDERKALIPADPKLGQRHEIAAPIQRRFYGTVGIDYMEGSLHALPTRKSTMALTVDKIDDQMLVLRLDGYAHLGMELGGKAEGQASRGSEVRILGTVHYDRKKQTFVRFDVAGIGQAWGWRMGAIAMASPWHYGIACELAGNKPRDLIAPYHILHSPTTGAYWGK